MGLHAEIVQSQYLGLKLVDAFLLRDEAPLSREGQEFAENRVAARLAVDGLGVGAEASIALGLEVTIRRKRAVAARTSLGPNGGRSGSGGSALSANG